MTQPPEILEAEQAETFDEYCARFDRLDEMLADLFTSEAD